MDRTDLKLGFNAAMTQSLRSDAAHDLVQQIDFGGNGQINYTEWMMATSLKEIITEANLQIAFEFFSRNTEKVNLTTIREAFKSQKFDDECL